MSFNTIIINNIKRNLRKYSVFILSGVVSVIVYYFFSLILNNIELIQDSFTIGFADDLNFIKLLLIIGIFFLTDYSINIFLGSRIEEFQIFYKLGISQKKMKKIIFIESLFLGIIITVFGIIIAFVFSKFMMMGIGRVLNKKINTIGNLKAIKDTIKVFFIIFIICGITEGRYVKGINKTYKERKPSLFLSIACIMMIICLLIISVRMDYFKSTGEIILFFILGFLYTLLALTELFPYVLTKISKIKLIYMDEVNMIFISNVREKTLLNRSVLFVMTMFLSISIFIFGILYVQKDLIDKNKDILYPIDIGYVVKEKDYNNIIDNKLKENNINFEKVKVTFYDVESAKYSVISESEYKKVANKLFYPVYNIEEGKAVILYNTSMSEEDIKKYYFNEVININGNKVKINKIGEKSIFQSKTMGNIIIVKDSSLMILPKDKKINYYMYNIQSSKKSIKELENIKRSLPDERIYIKQLELMKERGSAYGFFYLCSFVALVFFLMGVSFLYYKFYDDIKKEKGKYDILINLGISKKTVNSIINKEMLVMFFVPFLISSLNLFFIFKLNRLIYNYKGDVSETHVFIIYLFIYTFYFMFWKRKIIEEVNE
ncbi:FtsX-like permease family protein [Clostridium botulinum]|uniref:FtsX-like permease family protein n=1 Tax=Clostridium botulinum TaxID=1491 RepID=UPI000A1758FD|nr:FtsX-like permease family protein [Clostridium botulinum]AUN10337.1 peptide ABC transporter permease [Clostridium botulinum]OSA73490.1 peptide ABC transporter permease [Clostridium botulinum]